MNAAKLSRSNRLKRVYDALSKGDPLSTRDIIGRAKVCAVSAIISELRENGIDINCVRRGDVWIYTIKNGAIKAPKKKGEHLVMPRKL